MICKNCGEVVDDGLLLCPHCGQEISVVSRTPAPRAVDDVVEPAEQNAEPIPPTRAIVRGPQPVRRRTGHGPSGWVWLISLIVLISCVMVAFAAAGFGGLYQGLKERDHLNQVSSREHYNRGLEHLQAHESELAMAEFEESLRLDPRFTDAYERLKELRVKATVEPTPTSIIIIPQTVTATMVSFEDAQADFDAGNWSSAIAALQQLKLSDQTTDAAKIDELLFDAYVKQGEQQLADNSMEEALRSYSAALAIKPDDLAATEQKVLIDKYVTAAGLSGASYEEAIRQMTDLYNTKPDFADVKDQLYEDHVDYGDLLADRASWCDAADNYAKALELKSDPKVAAKQADMADKCRTDPPTPTPEGRKSVTDTINSVLPTMKSLPTAKPTKPAVAAAPAAKPAAAKPAPTEEAVATTAPVSSTTESAAPPAVAPAGGAPALSGVIAFSVHDPDQVYRIYQLKLDGNSAPEIIVQNGDQPAFSPDGTKLAFHSRQSDINGLRVADQGGRNGTNITKFLEDGLPTWGPDGTQVAFGSTRESDRRPRVFTTWAGGVADSVQVTLGEAPAWSKQGFIAYHGCDPSGGNCGIWRVAPNGGGASGLTTSESDTAPAWSPDGTQLAFMSARDGNWEVYKMNGDGSQPVRLTSNGANDGIPAWSPDGSTIAFVSDRGGTWGIYAVSANGGEPVKVWDTPNIADNWMEHRLSWRN